MDNTDLGRENREDNGGQQTNDPTASKKDDVVDRAATLFADLFYRQVMHERQQRRTKLSENQKSHDETSQD